MAAGKKESLFAGKSDGKKDGDGYKPEPMRNVEKPKPEDGERVSERDTGGGKQTEMDGRMEVMKRHAKERGEMHGSHERERRDMHGNHREEHRMMHHRHEEEHKKMMARHEAEMKQADTAMPAGAGPEMGTAAPAAAGATPVPGEA